MKSWKEFLLVKALIFDVDGTIAETEELHRKAYNKGDNVVSIDFQVIKKGKKTAAGHFGKAVKGQFVRYIAQNQITSTDQFEGFEYEGFNWDGNAFVKENG